MVNNNQTAPVSDEELDQMIWKLELDGGMTPKMLSLMRELREVRRAKCEPAAIVHHDEKGFHALLCRELPDGVPLYTVPPVLVAPDIDSMRLIFESIERDSDDGFNLHKYGIGYADEKTQSRWNAWLSCRAAMLNHSGDTADMVEPVSNRDELPLDYLQGHKDGLEWAAQLAEANHPQTGDWLYDDPIALAAAIRKGPDMPELKLVSADEDDNFYSWFGRFWSENYQQNNYTTSAKQMLGTMAEFAFRAGRESATQAGNSPATPDGWIPVSERMPDDNSDVLCATEFDGPGDWRRKVGYWHEGRWIVYGASWSPTHWMPLPAATKEVKDE